MPKCVSCELTNVKSKDLCKTCMDHNSRNNFFENSVKTYLLGETDLQHFTYSNVSLPCAETSRRPDFCYVLEDRVVVVEVDENEHRYNSMECEVRREQEILESIPKKMYLIMIRFNPNPKRCDIWTATNRLGLAIRQAFKTRDVEFTTDGIHKVFINYCTAQKRKVAQTLTQDQTKAL